jgi:probable phosphoglycerate mutase
LTDLPLTAQGEQDARALGARLSGHKFGQVITSPLKRAARTCELAGFGQVAEVDPLLVEWDYGRYEGLTSVEIRRERPDWELFRDGCPGGETLQAVSERADRVIERLHAVRDNTLIFSSGHFLRVLAARWLKLEPAMGRYLMLGTASLSVLGYEHNLQRPVIRAWNDTSQFSPAGEQRIVQTQ